MLMLMVVLSSGEIHLDKHTAGSLIMAKRVIHYAFRPDPLVTHSVVETQALPLSPKTINQVLDSIAEHAVPSV